MIRRISSLALGIAVTMAAAGALAQEEGGEAAGGEAAAGGEEEKPAEEAKPAEGGGEAKAGGEAAASTEGVPDGGGKIKLGLRVGYGLPMGEASKDNKMSDAVSGMIPIWLDLGYMVTPNIMVGLYAQYGLIMLDSKIKDACDDCSASDIRIGLQAQYHLSPGESLNPWFGLGIGYEMFNLKTPSPTGSGSVDANATGFEFANLQAGADFKVGDSMGVGPFASFSIGQYSKVEGNDIPEKSMHQWLVLGVKGTFGF